MKYITVEHHAEKQLDHTVAASHKNELSRESLEYAKGLLLMLRDVSMSLPVIDQALEGVNKAIDEL